MIIPNFYYKFGYKVLSFFNPDDFIGGKWFYSFWILSWRLIYTKKLKGNDSVLWKKINCKSTEIIFCGKVVDAFYSEIDDYFLLDFQETWKRNTN